MPSFRRLAAHALLLGLLTCAAAAQLQPDFTAAPLSGSSPLTVSFTDATTGATTQLYHSWNFGDGGFSSSPDTTHTYTAPGTYTVTLSVLSGFTLYSVTKVDLIEVGPTELVPDFTATPTTGINPLTVAFADASTGAQATNWSWLFGAQGGYASGEPTATHTYTAPGTYSVTFTAFVGPEGKSITKTDLIEVTPALLTPGFTATPTGGINPVTVSFTNTTTGPAEPTAWKWVFGDGSLSSAEQHPTHVYTLPGDHDVTLTAWVGQQPIQLTALDLVHVEPAPLFPDFSADVLAGAMPLTVSFTDLTTGTAPTGWSWNFGDSSSSSEQDPVHTFHVPGTYDIRLTAKFGAQTASLTLPDLITVVVPPTCEATDKLLAASGTGLSSFFHSVVIEGQTALISKLLDEFAGLENVGAISVVDLATGTERLELVPDTPELGGIGGAMDIDGNLALVASTGNDTLGPGLGAAFLFDLTTGAQLGTLLPSGDPLYSWYGNAVALDGDLALVGARFDDAAGYQHGAVYLYDVSDPTQPLLITKFLGEGLGISEGFGTSIALYEDTALIGQVPFGWLAKSVPGRAFLFDVSDPSQPAHIATLHAGGGYSNEYFGQWLALGKKHAVIGSPFDNEGTAAGSVYVFDANTGATLGRLLPLDDVIGKAFGTAVALDGKTLVVGDSDDDAAGSSSGAAYVFDVESLTQLARFTASDATANMLFGADVAIGGGRILVTTPFDDELGEDSGASYLIDVPAGTSWTDLGQALPGGAGPPALTAAGAVFPPCTVQFTLTNAVPSAPVFLVAGFNAIDAPFKGGVLLPSPDVVVAGLGTDVVGRLFLVESLPAGFPPGLPLVFQAWIVDAAGPSGFSASNGLSATTP